MKNLIFGIALGCFLFVASTLVFNLIAPEIAIALLDEFTISAFRFILISIGFSVGSIVHEIEYLRTGVKLIIHAAIGVGVLLIVGFTTDLFSSENYNTIITTVIVSVLVMLIVRFVYYIREKDEVRKINKRLQEQSSEKKLDTE